MNTIIRCVTTIAFLVFAAPLANADSAAPSHSCRKPGKAAEIKTQQEADKFNEVVNKYKSCIEDFVRQQEAASRITTARQVKRSVNGMNLSPTI